MLRPLAAARLGRSTVVAALDRRPLLNAVEHLQVHLKGPGAGGGRTWEMIAKFRNRLNTDKELLLYRHVLLPEVTGAPALYGSVCDHAASQYWLFLEPVRGDYWRVDDPAEIELAFAHLARLHAYFEVPAARALAGEPAALLYGAAADGVAERVLACLATGLGQAAFPTNRRRAFEALQRQVLAAAADPKCTEFAAPQARFLERLGGRLDRVLAALDLLPPTLVHHDFHRWNARVERDPVESSRFKAQALSPHPASNLEPGTLNSPLGSPRLRLMDWEGSSLGCRQFDLYYVPNPFLPWLQGQWDGAVPPELAEFALRCYWRAHNEHARARLTWDEFSEVQSYVSLYRCLIAAQLQLQGGPTGIGLPDPTRLSSLEPRHRAAARGALDDAARISRILGL